MVQPIKVFFSIFCIFATVAILAMAVYPVMAFPVTQNSAAVTCAGFKHYSSCSNGCQIASPDASCPGGWRYVNAVHQLLVYTNGKKAGAFQGAMNLCSCISLCSSTCK